MAFGQQAITVFTPAQTNLAEGCRCESTLRWKQSQLGWPDFVTKQTFLSNTAVYNFDNKLKNLCAVRIPAGWDKTEAAQTASCAADGVNSVSTDKPNWVLMSTSWGNVRSYRRCLYWSLPPACPAMSVGWVSVITTSTMDGWAGCRRRVRLCFSNILPASPSLMSLPQAGISLPWIKDITAS